jgi:hypothetical protein
MRLADGRFRRDFKDDRVSLLEDRLEAGAPAALSRGLHPPTLQYRRFAAK